MAMFEGQILALLGHNGAGKSTSINMSFEALKTFVRDLKVDWDGGANERRCCDSWTPPK